MEKMRRQQRFGNGSGRKTLEGGFKKIETIWNEAYSFFIDAVLSKDCWKIRRNGK